MQNLSAEKCCHQVFPAMKTKIAFLTGQSNPSSTSLSPVQTEFMKKIPVPEELKSYRNFPYTEGSAYSEVNILRASINNARQYLNAGKRSDEYSGMFNKYFKNNDIIIIISGSCGLHLFNSLNLSAEIRQKISIFAYGPTAHRIPECRDIFIVQGRKDWISRLWRLPVNEYAECGHMDYLNQKSVFDSCIRFLKKNGVSA